MKTIIKTSARALRPQRGPAKENSSRTKSAAHKSVALNTESAGKGDTPPLVGSIVIATDLSNESLPAVRLGAGLAERLGSLTAVLHVREAISSISGWESVVLARSELEVRSDIASQLGKLVDSEMPDTIPTITFIREGPPAQEILTAAQKLAANLVVLGTHGYTGARRILFGSTAEHVVRCAHCSVLTVPALTSKQHRLDKIILPLDFSRLSETAIPWAVMMAVEFGAELRLVHVVEEFPIDRLLGAESTSHLIEPLLDQTQKELRRLARRLGLKHSIKTSCALARGKPFKKICELGREWQADLIVMSTHGHSGLKRAYGSTAERVVRHAGRPVLIAR